MQQNLNMFGLLFVIFVINVTCITIPINRFKSRCMIIYSSDENENIKLDLKLPPIKEQTSQEYYIMTIHNTEDKSIE
jgi:hypothetical protein